MTEFSSATGSCLCGKVSLKIQQLDRDVIACHCSQCRKQTGHYFAATRAENAKIQVIGEEHISWYKASPSAERGFCKHCGSFLLWREADSLHTSISAGCLDSPTELELTSHIYVQDKGDYYKLDDGLPTFGQSD